MNIPLNRKQLVVALMMVMIYGVTLLYFKERYHSLLATSQQLGVKVPIPFVSGLTRISLYFIPVCLLGVLFIYSLRTKK
jgi:uncharacterized membrane protein YdjX (TVP38/TMEM64 family)